MSATTDSSLSLLSLRGWRSLLVLTKPRVNSLIVFTAVIGMLMAAHPPYPWLKLLMSALGIALVAMAAALINCLLERTIDARMQRTQHRATARGEVSTVEAMLVALVMGVLGLWVLQSFANALSAWLCLATFLGYALIYTAVLKPATPQNIVIGGASGAMPPLLGWVAISGQIEPPALVMFLIIFVWTPPHFWALASYRVEDYRQAGLPMLPVTHGLEVTTLHIVLYTALLALVSLLPYSMGMSGPLYALSALVLSLLFIHKAWRLHRHYSVAQAKATFAYSISYLGLIFAALLLDHWW